MSARLFPSLQSWLSVAFAFALTGCIFSPEYGPITTGTYVATNPRIFVCQDESRNQCDSLVTKTYWDVGTKRVKFKSVAGNRLYCRGGAILGDVHGDTLMTYEYRDSCMSREAGVFNPAVWKSFRAESVLLLLDQKKSNGFRARILDDSSWVDFRRLR